MLTRDNHADGEILKLKSADGFTAVSKGDVAPKPRELGPRPRPQVSDISDNNSSSPLRLLLRMYRRCWGWGAAIQLSSLPELPSFVLFAFIVLTFLQRFLLLMDYHSGCAVLCNMPHAHTHYGGNFRAPRINSVYYFGFTPFQLRASISAYFPRMHHILDIKRIMNRNNEFPILHQHTRLLGCLPLLLF